MQCPYCDTKKTKVVNTKLSAKGTVMRRRKCFMCGNRFTTEESVTKLTTKNSQK